MSKESKKMKDALELLAAEIYLIVKKYYYDEKLRPVFSKIRRDLRACIDVKFPDLTEDERKELWERISPEWLRAVCNGGKHRVKLVELPVHKKDEFVVMLEGEDFVDPNFESLDTTTAKAKVKDWVTENQAKYGDLGGLMGLTDVVWKDSQLGLSRGAVYFFVQQLRSEGHFRFKKKTPGTTTGPIYLHQAGIVVYNNKYRLFVEAPPMMRIRSRSLPPSGGDPSSAEVSDIQAWKMNVMLQEWRAGRFSRSPSPRSGTSY